jgi:hypothetical protein
LVDTFLRFAQNSFEEQQAALATFQKSFAKIWNHINQQEESD